MAMSRQEPLLASETSTAFLVRDKMGSDGRWKWEGCEMGCRFEFDPENKILLSRFEGPFTDESLAEVYREIRRYSTATDASVGILDLSSVTEFTACTEFVRNLASEEPAMADTTRRPRIIVAPTAGGYGLSRMFQLLGERTRPLLNVVRSLDQASAMLGIQHPHLEPLE